jgi:hypothetical protein
MAVESRDQPATADDLRILRRAVRFLETLPCGIAMTIGYDDDEASGKQIFCALQRPIREILGNAQHRNVALRKCGS